VSATSKGIYFVGEVLRALFRTFGKIGRPFAFLIGAFVLFILGIVWIATSGAMLYGLPYLSYFSPESMLGDSWIFLGALIFLGIPIATVVLFLLRNLFQIKINRWIYVGLWGAWFLVASCLGALGAQFGKAFNAESEFTKNYDLQTTETTPLQLEIGKDLIWDNHFKIGSLRLGDDYLIDGEVHIAIEKSNGSTLQLEQTNAANGLNFEQATQNAHEINYIPITETNRLVLQPHFLIPKGKKFRNQKVKLTLKMPVGKSFEFASDLNVVHMSIREKRNGKTSRYQDHFEKGQVWKMTESGLVCEKNCPTKGSSFDREEEERKNELREEMNAIKDDINDLKDNITDLKDDIKDKEDDLKDENSNDTKSNLRNEIRELERQIRDKEKEIQEKEAQLR
jgi:phage shock protein C